MEKIADLKEGLKKLKIRSDAYCLPGQYPSDNSYVIAVLPMDRFTVYYFERGLRIDAKVFEIERDAVKFFIKRITDDKSTQK